MGSLRLCHLQVGNPRRVGSLVQSKLKDQEPWKPVIFTLASSTDQGPSQDRTGGGGHPAPGEELHPSWTILFFLDPWWVIPSALGRAVIILLDVSNAFKSFFCLHRHPWTFISHLDASQPVRLPHVTIILLYQKSVLSRACSTYP